MRKGPACGQDWSSVGSGDYLDELSEAAPVRAGKRRRDRWWRASARGCSTVRRVKYGF